MGKLRRSISQLAYRMKLRKALQESSIEQLEISKEEINRELERRNKKK